MAEGVEEPREPAPDGERPQELLPARREETLPERPPSRELGFPSGPQPPSTYAPRFRMITGALVGVAIGALAATALLLAGGRPDPGPAWSAWKPSEDSTTDGAEEIARHVGGRYRLPSGDQLVLVTGGPLRVAGLDIPVRIALQGSDGADEVKGRTVMYQLCGLGPQCAINKGKPSTERFLLLRREALELALYSFRYLGGVKNVVAMLPPAPGKKPSNAMLFRRKDYESALDRPLNATLPSPPPTLRALPSSPETIQIVKLTERKVFRYDFQQGQDLTALLVLRALPGGLIRRLAVPVLVAAALAPAVPAAAAQRTPSVKPRAFASCAELIRHARRWEARTDGRVWAPMRGVPEAPAPVAGPQREDGVTVVASPAQPESGFSTTNAQEEGVDEPDAVKTDGRRIFAVAGGTLRAVATGGTPRLLGSLALPGGGAGHELLLRGDRLLVLSSASAVATARFAPEPVPTTTRIDEVDVSDPAAMRIRRTLEVDGAYVSARRNGDTARVVVSSSPYAVAVPAAATRPGGWLPRARLADARRGTTRRLAVGCRAVRRPVQFSGLGMLTVLTIDLDRGLPEVDGDALMTDAQTVYGSTKSLYVATQRWVDPATAPERLPSRTTTVLHRFDASAAGRTDYRAGGEVPGYLLNQFSLSEHRGVLRVATTEEPLWSGTERARESESFVTVLDQFGSRLEQVGRVGGLGRGERIYSVRFLGELGYVVTFRQVDPLYTLDLERPAAPRVAGELKLLGYSAYLHPLGADRLLGVGQDATEEGRTQGAQAVLFDVADPRAPRLLARAALGGTSSSSAVEYDHRAFLHWPATGLAVLPVQSYGDRGGERFAGAVALGVSRSGLREAGRIAHEGPVAISRSLVAAGRLFTLSERGLLASDLGSLAPVAWIPFAG